MARTRGAKRTNWKQEFNDAAEEVELLRSQLGVAEDLLKSEQEAHRRSLDRLCATQKMLSRAVRRLFEAAEYLATLGKPAADAAIRADSAELI